MNPDIRAILSSKAAALVGYLDLLDPKVRATPAAYLKNRDLQLQVERLCQCAIECAIDIADGLLESAGEAPPASAREGFQRLGQRTPAARDVCERFAKRYAGFRNRLVHEYETLDHRIVFETARKLAADGRLFLQKVSPLVSSSRSGRRKNGA
jgi:uncharacterized protein YutE (UPF0331/DUF86 family)